MLFSCNISTASNSGKNFRLSLDYTTHQYWETRHLWPVSAGKRRGKSTKYWGGIKMMLVLILKECFIDCGLTNWDMIAATDNFDKANILIKDNNYKKFLQNIKNNDKNIINNDNDDDSDNIDNESDLLKNLSMMDTSDEYDKIYELIKIFYFKARYNIPNNIFEFVFLLYFGKKSDCCPFLKFETNLKELTNARRNELKEFENIVKNDSLLFDFSNHDSSGTVKENNNNNNNDDDNKVMFELNLVINDDFMNRQLALSAGSGLTLLAMKKGETLG